MGKILGRKIAIMRKVNGSVYVIGLGTSCSVDMSTDMIEKAGVSSKYRSYTPGKHDVTIQIERLFDVGDSVSYMELQAKREPLSYVIDADGTSVSGEAYISQQRAAGEVNGYATHSITMRGTGDVTFDAGYITFADSLTKSLCAQHFGGGFDLTRGKAADVTDLGSAFTQTGIVSFDELSLFTGLRSVGEKAFLYCSKLASISLPDVESIGAKAFEGCSSLEELSLPASVKSIAESAFYKCGKLKSIAIPDGVETIESHTFANCTSLAAVTLPQSVKTLGVYAFYGCSSLGYVSLPVYLSALRYGAFAYCSSLVSMSIPEGIRNIGAYTFIGCTSLRHVLFRDHSRIVTLDDVSAFTDTTCKIYVPDGLYAQWKEATNWAAYADRIFKISEYTG